MVCLWEEAGMGPGVWQSMGELPETTIGTPIPCFAINCPGSASLGLGGMASHVALGTLGFCAPALSLFCGQSVEKLLALMSLA